MKPYYYVYRGGGPGPKYKHDTLESAKAEAERLALKCAGETFEILKCIGFSNTQVPKANTVFFNDKSPVKEFRDGEKEYPFPENLPQLPVLPKDKTRWVYRGTFGHRGYYDSEVVDNNRYVMYLEMGTWLITHRFSGSYHHVEAV